MGPYCLERPGEELDKLLASVPILLYCVIIMYVCHEVEIKYV